MTSPSKPFDRSAPAVRPRPANGGLAGPEHARLTAMGGTWDVEMTFGFRPGGPGVTTTGTSTIRPLFDGLFAEGKIEGTPKGAPFTTLAWTGFNSATHQYEATRIASTNTIRRTETGAYDEKAKRSELKADYPFAGDTRHQRTVIQPVSADTMTAASFLSFGKTPEWKGVEIKYTRRGEVVDAGPRRPVLAALGGRRPKVMTDPAELAGLDGDELTGPPGARPAGSPRREDTGKC